MGNGQRKYGRLILDGRIYQVGSRYAGSGLTIALCGHGTRDGCLDGLMGYESSQCSQLD